MCTQIWSYILGRWQNFTPNTKYLSPHSSPVGRPFYYRATGRTLLSIILAAFVRYEYEERGGFSSSLVSSRLCERTLPSKRQHLPVIVEPCVAGEQLDSTVFEYTSCIWPLKVAVNTIVPRSPFFLFLYLKTQTVTHIRKNAVEYLRQWNGAICVIYNLCQRQNIR